jgi:hypothetical protein
MARLHEYQGNTEAFNDPPQVLATGLIEHMVVIALPISLAVRRTLSVKT